MGIEIERKFLVSGTDWKSSNPVAFCQGYLSREKARTVRVRIAGDSAFLTIKGLSTGASRAEFEYEIPLEDARELLNLCELPLIEKYRHFTQFAGMLWEIDEFLGDNRGLVVAELELDSEDQSFERPPWLGREVTDDFRYSNSRLSIHPFSDWNQVDDGI